MKTKKTKEYYESFIGKSFIGFKFTSEEYPLVSWVNSMSDLVGKNVDICSYSEYNNSFGTEKWDFPADLVIKNLLKTKRVYTKSTPRLVELHKKYGTGGSVFPNETPAFFSNCNAVNETGHFWNDYGRREVIEFFVENNFKELSEQEFIYFMEFPCEATNAIEPDHYTQFDIQPIDYIEANNLDFFEGNVVKYVSRYKSKSGLEDLKKAQVYLQRLIDRYEKD